MGALNVSGLADEIFEAAGSPHNPFTLAVVRGLTLWPTAEPGSARLVGTSIVYDATADIDNQCTEITREIARHALGGATASDEHVSLLSDAIARRL